MWQMYLTTLLKPFTLSFYYCFRIYSSIFSVFSFSMEFWFSLQIITALVEMIWCWYAVFINTFCMDAETMIRKCLASIRILVFRFHTLQMVDEKAALAVNAKIYYNFFHLYCLWIFWPLWQVKHFKAIIESCTYK